MTDAIATKAGTLRGLLDAFVSRAEAAGVALLGSADVRRGLAAAETLGATGAASVVVGLCPSWLQPVVRPIIAGLTTRLEAALDEHISELSLHAGMVVEGQGAGAGDPKAALLNMSPEDAAAAVAKAYAPAPAK